MMEGFQSLFCIFIEVQQQWPGWHDEPSMDIIALPGGVYIIYTFRFALYVSIPPRRYGSICCCWAHLGDDVVRVFLIKRLHIQCCCCCCGADGDDHTHTHTHNGEYRQCFAHPHKFAQCQLRSFSPGSVRRWSSWPVVKSKAMNVYLRIRSHTHMQHTFHILPPSVNRTITRN